MCVRSRSTLVRASIGFFCFLGLLISAAFGDAQGLRSSDLLRLRSVGAVELSPDAQRIAYTIIMRDRPGRPYSQLWIMELATQKSLRIGGEKDATGSPRWSPDGKWLALHGSIGDKAESLWREQTVLTSLFLRRRAAPTAPCRARATT